MPGCPTRRGQQRPHRRTSRCKGKPGGPQFLRLTPGNTTASQMNMNKLDNRARPNAGVSGRPQAQKIPSVEGLKDVPR